MSKETTIVFVYDTQLVKKEEDDPASAILYFHPSWVSDQQKTALCGQLMGTIHCLKSLFSLPKIVSLQCGKFSIVENGRYVLATGTDRNSVDWVLENRAKMLYSLLNFYHKDIEALAQMYNYESLCAKLYYIFEAFLRVLSFGGNVFTNIPSLTLPKSGSNVFSEAIHILQRCQEYEHALGGILLYHNKVVATQLSPDLTKRIVLSDPYRIKCSAEVADLTFEIPTGVQLLQVYISNKEYSMLLESSLRNKSIIQYSKNKSIKHDKMSQENSVSSSIKRDQSLLFTAVPEEGTTSDDFIQTKPPRPKFLNLKSVSIESTKSGFVTPYGGQASIATTPMTESKKFVEEDNHIPNVSDETTEDISKLRRKLLNRKNSSLTDICSISNGNGQYLNGQTNLKKVKSLADPTFPIFKTDGTIISKLGYEDWGKNIKTIRSLVSYKRKPSENFNTCLEMHDKAVKKNTKPSEAELRKLLKEKRKSLTLPLKSLTDPPDPDKFKPRRFSHGVQLTPLMSKLSILADEEKNSNIRDSTPGEFKILTPSQPNFKFIFEKNSKDLNNCKQDDPNAFRKCILFVCGRQDIVLTLLMRTEICSDKQTIKKLREICTERLANLERQLNFCMESQSTASSTLETEHYSYLCLNSQWDTTKRGGPWPQDFRALNTMHEDFKGDDDITEILLRRSDSIIFGHRLGEMEVYYQEPANVIGGLPSPTDAMGLVQSKANRRLERDHTLSLK